MDDLDRLKKDLDDQTRLAEDRLERLKYLQADFDNYRKWYEKEKTLVIAIANENLVKDLLVILDDFERAIPAIRNDIDQEGVRMVYTKMLRILASHGVQPIECTGKKFDPGLHEAVCREACDNEPGTITREISTGYKLNSKVIRPSKVMIAEQSSGKEGETDG